MSARTFWISFTLMLVATTGLAQADGQGFWIGPPFPPGDAQITVPDTWQAVDRYPGTPNFADPHYREAYTRVYRFVDPQGRERHVFLTFCSGDERGKTPTSDQAGQPELQHEDQRAEEEPAVEPVKAKRLKVAPLQMMTIGEHGGDEEEELDEDEDGEAPQEESR